VGLLLEDVIYVHALYKQVLSGENRKNKMMIEKLKTSIRISTFADEDSTNRRQDVLQEQQRD
jgi:hypothetical protein